MKLHHQFLLQLMFLTSFLLSMDTNAQIAQFGGINRNGIFNETNLLNEWPQPGAELVATMTGIGDGYGSATITDRGIYIAGTIDSIGYISHFDLNYQLKWKTEVGKEFTFKYVGSRGTPTIENNRLYYVASMGDAVCLDATSGEKVWSLNIQKTYNGPKLKWGYTESPLIYQDKVFFTPGGEKNNFIALNKTDGKLIWKLDLDSAVNAYCSPVVIKHKGKDYILLNTNIYLLLIDPENGNIKVKHPIPHNSNNHALAPLYRDGKIFYSSGYGEGTVLFKIDETKAILDTLYQNKDFDCKLSGMILFDGTVFGTSDQKKQWVGVDFESGNTIFTSRDLKPGSIIQADNKFYLYSDVGEIALAIPSKPGFEIKSRFQIPAGKVVMAFAHPVISNGILYIRFNNNLWAYKIK